jgi:tartrate-resistant acid phosphatase type 5
LLFGLVASVGCKRVEPARAGPTPSSVTSTNPSAAATAQVAPEKRAGAARFAVIGDFGADSRDEARVAALVKSWRPDFVITTGDNNYPSGAASTIDANIGKYYSEFIGNYRGRFGAGSPANRFWPSPGNHDWISGLGAYLDYFTLPGNERYYDVDLGLVHLYALDSDPHEPDGVGSDSVQATWLKDRLTSSKSCYDVVFFHHPAYSSSEHGSSKFMRWPFRAWGAEVVLAGHDHSYERVLVDGIPYFVIGLGGASKYGFPRDPLAETQFRYNEDFGAMLVDAAATGVTYQFFTAEGAKLDSLAVPAGAACAQ